MVHKKYIKRNGKVYGPYYYKSKRVGDKVVSEYVGEGKDRKISRKTLIILGFVLLSVVFLMLVFLLINSGVLTGKIVSDSDLGDKEDSVKNTISMTGNTINSGTIESFENLDQDFYSDEFSQSVRNFKNWVIVTFRKGENVGEYSYSNSLSQSELDQLIERDRILWLEKISS